MQGRALPPETRRHSCPCVVECVELRLGPYQGKEHGELGAVQLLEETTEHIVVIEEVATSFGLTGVEWTLHVDEESVQLIKHNRARCGWLHTRDKEDDLQPLLDVLGHI